MKINNEKIEKIHIKSIEAEPLIKRFQQEEIENESLLQSFDEELCDLMEKYIDVNHKYRDCMPFFDDKDIVEDFNYALNILQRLIKETYKKGVIKEDTILGE
tara:strand:- start:380 stop:685 length:306 start_codon:yes stop_codon:yes gene_type:complete